jgi:hypothetical protein
MGQKILFTITLTPLNFIEYCQRVFNYGKHRNILLNSAKKTLEISIFRQEGLLEPLAYYTHFFPCRHQLYNRLSVNLIFTFLPTIFNFYNVNTWYSSTVMGNVTLNSLMIIVAFRDQSQPADNKRRPGAKVMKICFFFVSKKLN